MPSMWMLYVNKVRNGALFVTPNKKLLVSHPIKEWKRGQESGARPATSSPVTTSFMFDIVTLQS